MGTNEARVGGTCGVWAAVVIVGVAAITNAMFLGGLLVFLLVMILAIVAGVSTQSIWGHAHEDASHQIEKSKRHSRVDRVLAGMDDDELEELRTRLTSDSDGEVVSINDLLAEREHRRS